MNEPKLTARDFDVLNTILSFSACMGQAPRLQDLRPYLATRSMATIREHVDRLVEQKQVTYSGRACDGIYFTEEQPWCKTKIKSPCIYPREMRSGGSVV